MSLVHVHMYAIVMNLTEDIWQQDNRHDETNGRGILEMHQFDIGIEMEIMQYKARAILIRYHMIILIHETLVDGFEQTVCYKIGNDIFDKD